MADGKTEMYSIVTEWLDRIALRTATPSVKAVPGWMENVEAARELSRHPDFFSSAIQAPADFAFTTGDEFRFGSPISSAWPENDVVHGRFFRAGNDWKTRSTVLLLHGWNAELAYRRLFPWLASRCNRRGLNAAMIELPFHGRRKPRPARLNFLSGDLVRVLQATRQAVADIRAMIAWLAVETEGAAGVCGFSLGAWLSGFVASYEPRNQFAVLATPVGHMERAIRELPFCVPIRSSCEESNLWPTMLNLVEHKPCIPPKRILLMESKYDLFAPAETVEEIWEAWGRTEIWRLRHGHISILMALPTLERMIAWMGETAESARRETSSSCARTGE